jgi:hypothetical protein
MGDRAVIKAGSQENATIQVLAKLPPRSHNGLFTM